MATFEHIIFATDFGAHAAHAEAYAVRLATELGAKLTVAHVVMLTPPVYAEALAWPVNDLEKAGRDALEATVARIRGRHAATMSYFRAGQPADAIVDAAREIGADAIVIGTHGRRGLTRMFLGSVAERVLRLATVPVIAVPPAEK
jgi:nucleotide-binding universal stress UspA family protein